MLLVSISEYLMLLFPNHFSSVLVDIIILWQQCCHSLALYLVQIANSGSSCLSEGCTSREFFRRRGQRLLQPLCGILWLLSVAIMVTRELCSFRQFSCFNYHSPAS